MIDLSLERHEVLRLAVYDLTKRFDERLEPGQPLGNIG